MSERARPTGPKGPWVVCLGLAAVLLLIGRTTGSGWSMVIVSCLLATLGVSLVWPALVLRRVTIALDTPRDGTAGRALEARLTVGGTGLGVRVRVPELGGEWVSAEAPAEGAVQLRPPRRGVVRQVTVEVRTAAPLGLITWRRADTVTLGAALEVGPEPTEAALPPVSRGQVGDLRPPDRRSGSEGIRSVRDYVAGDPARFVHWGATARRGDLMVKELEDPEGALVALVVDLRAAAVNGAAGDADGASDAEASERTASRAAGMAAVALRQGLTVLLLTAEESGPRVGPVANATEVGRRLARATTAAPPEGPLPDGAAVIRVAAPTSQA